jgi:hypothetical protein
MSLGRQRRIAADILREELQLDGQPTSALSDIFDTEPVPLTTFVQDEHYLANPHLSPVQYNFVRHVEQIYQLDLYPAMVEEFGEYWTPVRMCNRFALEWGKGGGKDSMCRIASVRVADLLLCLKSPQQYFNMPHQDEIQLLNIASSSAQAHTAFFRPLRTLLIKSPRFKDTFRTEEPGSEARTIRLEKGIELISGHSMAESQEGMNLILGIADEISAFKTKDEIARSGRSMSGREPAKTAESILDMLHTSASTRFPQTYKVVQISYPRFKGDAIEQAVAYARADNLHKGETSKYYVSGPLATWDVRPGIKKEFYADDYEKDPVLAAAKYECLPSESPNRYFKNDLALLHTFGTERPAPIEVEYYWGLSGDQAESRHAPQEIPGWQVRFHFHPDFVAMRQAKYAIHGDLAITGDRAGIAMSHVRTHVEKDSQRKLPVVKNDFTFAFESDMSAQTPMGEIVPREVVIRWYRKLVWELFKRKFRVRSVTFDQFQSKDMQQLLEARGIESGTLSLDRTADVYKTVRDTLYDGRLEGYYDALLLTEFRGLTLLNNGKVDHPAGSSKDMADALGGSVFGALKIGGTEGADPMPVNAWAPVMAGSIAAMPGMQLEDAGPGSLAFSGADPSGLLF